MATTTLNTSVSVAYNMTNMDATNLTSNLSGTCSPPATGADENLSSSDIYLIVLYVLIGTIGILGNSMVCAVFGLVKSRRSQVNLFIFHQAIVDLFTSCFLILFGLTQIFQEEITARTTYTVIESSNSSGNNDSCSSDVEVVMTVSMALSEFMCRVWWPRVILFSLFAVSTFNLTTMAVERYLAIMHPFFYATKFKRRHALVVIVFIWLLAPIMQFFPAIFQYDALSPTGECILAQDSWTAGAQAALGVCLFLWEFIFPTFIMFFSSFNIIRVLRRRKQYLNRANTMPGENGKSRKRFTVTDTNVEVLKANRNTTIVVIIIAIVYVVCWAPNHITFLGFNLGMPLDFAGKWYHTTVFLAFINCCTNPFIYAIRLKTFQRGLLHVCRTGCKPVNSSQFDSAATASHYDVNAPFL